MDMKKAWVCGVLAVAAAVAAAGDDAVWGRAPDGTFWNGFSKWAMRPPAFAFAPVEGAAKYRFVVIDDRHGRQTFEHESPQASLAPVWDKVPSNGFVTVECRALDARGRVCGLAGERKLFKTAPFAGEKAYPPAKRPIERAAAMAFDYVFERIVRDLREQGRPDPKYALNSYPSKMQAAVISALVEYARLRPDRRAESLRLARVAADYLISTSEPSGAPLAHLPPTYFGTANEAGRFAGQIMMIYPPDVGLAYLDLHGATEDPKYLQAAERIAATLLRLQGEDGSWYLKLWTKDGSPVAPNRCVPLRHVEFLEALAERTGRPDYAAAAKRAFDYLDRGPLTDWNWEGQFEDVAPSKPYSNLTKHDACATACYLARRFPKDARRIGQAKALLEFAEDQFVMWERPCRRDGIGPSSDVPEDQRFAGQCDYEHWHVPCVVEQYGYALPVDASSARLIQTYLALNEVAPDPLYVEKARTLANAMTRVQFDSGCIPTIWLCKAPDVTVEGSGWCWRNCHVASAFALLRLCAEGASAAFVDPAACGSSPSAAAEAKERVLIFGAHPDENIACAGTMLLMKDQFELHVGVMTHGERGLGLKGFLDGSTKARRTKEEEAAAELANAKVHWFDEVDGDCYANREVCRKVADLLKELKPRAVIAMWPLDVHLDHVMSSACIQKAIGIAGMRDKIELYFMEEAYDSRTFVPAHYVDITEVADAKREFIRKHACQNRDDGMCRMEMEDGGCRAQRSPVYSLHGRAAQVERFAEFDGKPQGSRCIFNEMKPPKGWSQSWETAKPSRYTPEGGMK